MSIAAVQPQPRTSPPQTAGASTRSYRQIGDMLALLAIALIALSFLLPTPVARTQIILTLAVAFLGRHELIPALLLLQVKRTDFLGGQSADFELLVERFTEGALRIGPFPISVGYALIIGTIACVVYVSLTAPQLLRGRLRAGPAILFLTSLAVAFAISILSRQELIPTWTSPVRAILPIAAFYYGVILYRRNPKGLADTVKRIMIISVAFSLYTILRGRLASELEYLYLAAAAAYGGYLCIQRPLSTKAGGIFILLISVLPAFGFTLIGFTGTRTLTTIGTAAAACGITALAFLLPITPYQRQRREVGRTLAFSTALVMLFAIVLPPVVLPKLTLGIKTDITDYGGGEGITLRDRIQYKIGYDRPCVWRGYWREVLTPPYIIHTIPTDVKFIFPDGRESDWPFGAHNLALSILATNRWLSGTHYLACFSYCFFVMTRASFIRNSPLSPLSIPLVAFAGISSIGGGSILLSGPAILFYMASGLSSELEKTSFPPNRKFAYKHF